MCQSDREETDGSCVIYARESDNDNDSNFWNAFWKTGGLNFRLTTGGQWERDTMDFIGIAE